MLSSGNFLADRRYGFAEAAAERGDHAGAADILRQTLDLVPDWPVAWFVLGEALEDCGEPAQAAAAFQRALDLDALDGLGAALRLARLGARPPPAAASGAYMRALFDGYAPRFDDHLVGGLAYRAPQLLASALASVSAAAGGDEARFADALDLGCGTGLAARALVGRVTSFIGVDLSPAMLAVAARTGLYAELHTSDLGSFLARRAESTADLVLAADVFVYIGDLSAVFAGVARVLRQGGLFAFTAQSGPLHSYALGADLRYAHSTAYLAAEAGRAGFTVAHLETASSRRDQGRDVPGLVVVLR
jgi:predicted TPR repeat methyltransferase